MSAIIDDKHDNDKPTGQVVEIPDRPRADPGPSDSDSENIDAVAKIGHAPTIPPTRK